jgi:hypothetical protein
MTGEISDTYLYKMAQLGSADGRPMRLFSVSDFDPSGWQMPISIGRKLQAFRDLEFPDLDFEVRSVALTVDQVRELGLPSAPMKATEKRADRWREAFGVDQVEIDSLSELRPEVLDRIVRDALRPFIDYGLETRVMRAKLDWLREAEEIMAAYLDEALLDDLRDRATTKLAELEQEVAALNEALRQEVPARIPLPPVEIPAATVDESLHGLPLISARWPWAEQTRALIARKSYGSMT